jgi:tRNA-dihydrouridine synthase B
MPQLGDIKIEHPFVQAALSGYSDAPMRRIARRHGAAYTLNEVVLDKLVLTRGKGQKRVLRPVELDDHPVGGQLMGSLTRRRSDPPPGCWPTRATT